MLAILNHPDRDSDLILPGACANGPGDLAAVSRRDHNVILDGAEPVGHAVIYEEGDKLLARVVYYDEGDNG